MARDSLFTQGGTCICADTTLDLCGCQSPSSSPLCVRQAGSFDHSRAFHTDIVSTRADHEGDPIDFDFGIGYNWTFSAWPYITDIQNDSLLVALPGYSIEFSWDSTGVAYSGENGYTLSYDKPASRFTLTDPEGGIWQFVGFKQGIRPKGRFQRYRAANGDTATVSGYTDHGHITQTIWKHGTGQAQTIEYYDYAYQVQSDNAERLQTLTKRVQLPGESAADAERFDYTYHSSGDLETVTQMIYVDSQWVEQGVHYYRYYSDSDPGGGAHRVKYALNPQQYATLAADPEVSNPLTASDAKVGEYATYSFQYGTNLDISSLQPLAGGEITYSHEYGDLTGTDHNAFEHKVVETHEDGSQRVHYANHRGRPLVTEFKENSSVQSGSIDYYEYDANGNVTLHATPSAIASYSVDLNDNVQPTYRSEGGQFTVGLVHLATYYTQTTTGSGGVAVKGRKEFDKIRQGRDSTAITLRKYEYTQREAQIVLEPLPPVGSSSSSSSSGPGDTVDTAVYPLYREILYKDEQATQEIITSYSYTWHSGSAQMQQRVTTPPAIAAAQNGSGTSATRTERFDEAGNLIWLKDERGFITHHQYQGGPRLVTRTIQDVDGAQLTLPSGWSTPSGGGLHLVTDYEYDSLGRLTQVLGPEHDVQGQNLRTANWTVYKDAQRETRSAQGYAVELSSSSSSSGGGQSEPSYSFTLVNPVTIQKRNATGTRAESIQATRASTSGKLSASDTFAQSSYTRWTVSLFSTAGQQTAMRAYHMIPSSGDGSSGTNYDETTYGHDSLGRQNKTSSPGGTITRNVFDEQGRIVCSYVGTDDTGATDSDPSAGREPCSLAGSSSSSSSSSSAGATTNNMVLVIEQEYEDSGCAGCGSGSGQLVLLTQHVDGSTTRVIEYQYDWRGRRELVVPPADDEGRTVYTRFYYDNLDRNTKVERYHEQLAGSDILISREETFFDDQGRTYKTRRYAVNVTSGTVGNYLAGYSWYDAAGNLIKQQAEGQQHFTKTVYDGVGRSTKHYVGYDTSEAPGSGYSDATSVTGDTILEQLETDYDEAGSVILATRRRRLHDATGTGELTTVSGLQPKARVSYLAYWHDEVGRQIAEANYGTNADASLTRPASVPTRSDTVLVSEMFYNDSGQAFKTVDPAGREDRQELDDAGRVTKTIENYTDGDPTTGNADEDRTVEFTYNADGLRATIKARQQSASNDQVTTYVYGTTLADSSIARSDLLRAEIYPDSDDVASPLGSGSDGIYDRIEYQYNRQGQRTQMKDQNGTVHAYDYDLLGRQTQDCVTALGSGVDGAVRRIATTYEVRGLREKTTSYDNAAVGQGSVINEVLAEYNDSGMLAKEYQEHDGAKDGSTLYVGYNYDDSASGGKFTKGLRQKSLRYPSGRLVHYTYGSSGSADDVLSRLQAIKDDNAGVPGTTLASYTYLGLGDVVIEDYEEPNIRLDLFGGTSGTYAGLDRFDRVIDQRWYDYGSSADVDRFKYGYDRASNRIWKENVVAAANGKDFDEFYTYDGLYRLENFDRGDLNATKTGISGTPGKEEDWSLDPLGNWSSYVQKSSGTTDLDQDRTVNKVNEITGITETVGTAWATPAYDRNGNMTTIPKPADPANTFTASYDAWNRLVAVQEGMAIVSEYAYDGLRRRITTAADSSTNHAYYSEQWQELERRIDASAYAQQQFVWGPLYVDHLIVRDRDISVPTNGTLDERLFATRTHNWSVTSVLDSGGNIKERYAYDPYGPVHLFADTHTAIQSSAYKWDVHFTGRGLESDTTLFNYRRRYLHACLGGFVTRDVVNEANLYVYVRNNPISHLDPSGMLCASCCCCADSLSLDPETVAKEHPYINPRSFGHYFELVAQLSLRVRHESASRRCGLQWWEWSDTVPKWINRVDEEEFDKIYERFGIDMCGRPGVPPVGPGIPEYTYTRWCRFFYPTHFDRLTCPSTHAVRLVDAPQIERKRNALRNLYFRVVITSAQGCGCDKSVVWEGCQFLKVDDNGRIVEHDLFETKDKCEDFPDFMADV